MSSNPKPYSAPNQQPIASESANWRFSPVTCGLVLIPTFCLLFAIAGGLVAVLLNRFAPGYYPGVFPDADRSGDALGVGKTVGVFQGLTLGFWIGIAVAVGLGRFRQLRPVLCGRALAIIIGFGIGFAVIGTFAGYTLGIRNPAYYRSVISGGKQPNFNPVDVGIGLGCSEGLMLGVIVGTLVALVLAWRRSRADPRPLPVGQTEADALSFDSTGVPERRGRSLVFRLCLGFVHAFVGLIVSFISLFHMCELSIPSFERMFLIGVPALCFTSVIWLRRYRYSLAATVVILVIAWNVGQEYLNWLHHH